MRFQPTVRLRLTLFYGGMFLAAGAVLLALNYALVQRSITRQNGPVGISLSGGAGTGGPIGAGPGVAAGGDLQFVRPAPAPDQFVTTDGRRLDDVLAQFEAQLNGETLHQLVVQSAIALGLMALASVGLGYAVAGRALRPLQDMTRTARRLSETSLHERLALDGPADELKELADTFDDMLGRLEAAFESQRRFVANASHELRTPLAIQRTVVDVALADPEASPEELRAMAGEVRDAVDRSEHLIDGLLVLARSQRGLGPVEPVAVDLAGLTARVADEATGDAASAGLTIRRDLRPSSIDGNPVLVERLVANLVGNAVRHNRPGGWIEVLTASDGASATLTVRNSGASVPPEQVPGLFEPFGRLGPERVGNGRGHGLGLSIVDAVTRAHRGNVRAEPLDGGGLAVTVSLPAR